VVAEANLENAVWYVTVTCQKEIWSLNPRTAGTGEAGTDVEYADRIPAAKERAGPAGEAVNGDLVGSAVRVQRSAEKTISP